MPPKVEVRLLRATLGAWEHFREHHYKTETISGDAEAFVALARREGPEGWLLAPGGDARGGPVGFVATIRQAGKAKEGGLGPRRAHRTVVLPEWQGFGESAECSCCRAPTTSRFACHFTCRLPDLGALPKT